MVSRTRFIGIALALLGLSACTGSSRVARHWGEAQRNASEAMIAAGRVEPGRGIDGTGAHAAHQGYTKALENPGQAATPDVLFNFTEKD